MSDPVVSVLMCAYNDARWLPEALETILTQSLRALELVVVDDGSTDATPALLEDAARHDPRVRVLRVPHGRPARALNHGLGAVRGRYVARIDADDRAHPERLARQVEHLERHPELGILGSDVEKIDAVGRVTGRAARPRDDAAVRFKALLWCPFTSSAVMLRREVLERASLRYDESLRGSEDYDFFARVLEHTRGANLARPLAHYRVREEGFSRRNRDAFEAIAVGIARGVIDRWLPAYATDEAEVAQLRSAFHGMGRAKLAPGPEGLRLARRYLALLDAFAAACAPEAAALARLRAAEARRFVHALAPGLAPQRLGLALRLCRADPAFPLHWLRAWRPRRRAAGARTG